MGKCEICGQEAVLEQILGDDLKEWHVCRRCLKEQWKIDLDDETAVKWREQKNIENQIWLDARNKIKSEYKPERANGPSKYVLGSLKSAYMWLRSNDKWNARICLIRARDSTIDQRVVGDIKSVYDLIIDTPEKAMARIEEILTCGGRIYDEFSEFLKGEKN